MIKKDICRMLYQNHGGLTLDEAETYINALLGLLKDTVNGQQQVVVTNFGKFQQKKRPVRKVILPNGETSTTLGLNRVQFRPSAKLKSRLNG